MNAEIIKKVIAEWLEDKILPPLIKRGGQEKPAICIN